MWILNFWIPIIVILPGVIKKIDTPWYTCIYEWHPMDCLFAWNELGDFPYFIDKAIDKLYIYCSFLYRVFVDCSTTIAVQLYKGFREFWDVFDYTVMQSDRNSSKTDTYHEPTTCEPNV